MTLLVRQLQPGEKGIPIEIYCFTGTTEWAVYEGIQADIFDHVLAQCGEFGLSVFQAPSGTDVAALRGPSGIDRRPARCPGWVRLPGGPCSVGVDLKVLR